MNYPNKFKVRKKLPSLKIIILIDVKVLSQVLENLSAGVLLHCIIGQHFKGKLCDFEIQSNRN